MSTDDKDGKETNLHPDCQDVDCRYPRCACVAPSAIGGTPRTDAEAVLFGRLMLTPNEPTGKADWRPFESTELVPADFARQLERELAEAMKVVIQAERVGANILERFTSAAPAGDKPSAPAGFTELEQQIIRYGFFRKQQRMEEAEELFRQIQRSLRSAELDSIPEGCTPADARVLREANHRLAEENHRLERERDAALQACCPGNNGEPDPVRCQSYEASEQSAPCPAGCCVMADPKEVRATLEAIEREEGCAHSAIGGTPRTDAVVGGIATYSSSEGQIRDLIEHARQLERELAELRRSDSGASDKEAK